MHGQGNEGPGRGRSRQGDGARGRGSDPNAGRVDRPAPRRDPGAYIGRMPERAPETIPGGLGPRDERVSGGSSGSVVRAACGRARGATGGPPRRRAGERRPGPRGRPEPLSFAVPPRGAYDPAMQQPVDVPGRRPWLDRVPVRGIARAVAVGGSDAARGDGPRLAPRGSARRPERLARVPAGGGRNGPRRRHRGRARLRGRRDPPLRLSVHPPAPHPHDQRPG